MNFLRENAMIYLLLSQSSGLNHFAGKASPDFRHLEITASQLNDARDNHLPADQVEHCGVK
jgi:hypothetical protein